MILAVKKGIVAFKEAKEDITQNVFMMSNPDFSPPPTDLSTFLTSPTPQNCTSTPIDFSISPLPEYTSLFALLIHNLLTPSECKTLLTLAQNTTDPPNTWAPAEINVGHGKQRMILEARNCGRIIWDDFTVAERLMARIMPHLPENIVTLKGKESVRVLGWGPVRKEQVWRISRMNERLRFLKYTAGMYFREHCDGSYATPDGREVSFLTVHLYLNGGQDVGHTGSGDTAGDSVTTEATDDPENQPLKGGSTRFSSLRDPEKYLDINPEMGACLVFQHKNLVHSGEEVESGVKYTLRSDIMYEKVGEDGRGVVTGK